MPDKNAIVSVVTPTTGKDSLFNLIESMSKQGVPINHILLWDNKREGRFSPTSEGKMSPEELNKENYWTDYHYLVTNIILNGELTQGTACGSALRAVGLMAANTEFVTFADDDVVWEDNHLISMLEAIDGKNWAYCKRKIWNETENKEFEYIGVDEFESVGEEAKTPYKMVDNNCMMFKRRFGSSAACLYRETKDYNDDRLMYGFLKQYAGIPGKTNQATVNQVCPKRLVGFFRTNCTK